MVSLKKFSKVLVWALSFAIIFTFSIPGELYANTDINSKDNDVAITVISENQIYLESDTERFMVTQSDTSRDNIYKTTFVDLDTGEENYFIINKNSKTLTSSVTGKTFSIAEDLDQTLETPSEYSMETRASGYYKYVSYRTIFNALGYGVTLVGLVALLMSIGGVGTVLLLTSAVVQFVSLYMKPNATTYHGIKLWVTSKVIKKHQGGGIIYVTVKQGTYAGRY